MVKLGGRGPALPLSSSEVAQRPSCALPGPEWKDWGSGYTLHHWRIAHGDQSSQPARNQPTLHSHQHSTSLRDVWTSGDLPDLRTNKPPVRTDLPEHPCPEISIVPPSAGILTKPHRGWMKLMVVKSPEIQKYPEGTVEGPEFGGSLRFPLEIAPCFELRKCLGIYIYITVYITYMYIYNHVHTFIIDVGKWGVLGSADDDIAFFLHILTCFIVHGKICLQVTSNSAYLQYMEDTGRSKIR